MTFLNKYKWLLPMLLFTMLLLAIRIVLTGSIVFLFIVWNLFLAIVPLFISHLLNKTTDTKKAWTYLATWLLFFPNAMYIVTDLFHLHDTDNIPEWFDLLLLFSAALTGVIIGFISLHNIEQYLLDKFAYKHIKWTTIVVFFLCGYGIYLGRYLRWNSWDIVAQPLSLFMDVKQDVFHPFRNIECWLLSILFGTWLYILYKFFIRVNPTPQHMA